MNKENERLIALFIDFDNIAIGLKESGGKPFEVQRVLERLLEKGRIIYKRAYADWYLFSEAKHALHEHAIEMIDIPMRRNIGKNSADIRLVVDALDLCYTKEHIDTFVIGSGDSDFTPLVSKLKENDKVVIGFGLSKSTSNLLANNCDEFIFYEDLVSLQVTRPELPAGLTKRQHDAFDLLLDAVAALMRENKDALWGSLIKDTIRRKRPSFTEGQFGYSSFSQLLEDAARHKLIGLIKDPKSGGTPVVTGFGLTGELETMEKSAAQAAPLAVRGPSLQVKAEPSRLLSLVPPEEEAKAKPARAPRPRRKSPPRRTAAEKAAEAAAAEKPVVVEVEPVQAVAPPEPAAKKPARRSSRRRGSGKTKEAAVEEAEAKPQDVVTEKPVKAQAPEPVAAAVTAKERPRSQGSGPDSSATKPETAESAPVKGAVLKTEESQREVLPRGEPLRSRVRRRRR